MMKYVVILTTLLAAAIALAPRQRSFRQTADSKSAQILKSDFDMSPEGNYQYAYETDNGIQGQENAQIQAKNVEEASKQVQGGFSWISPEGETISISYIADENGYQPSGSHLPTPPPIPEAILRSLEFIRTHPQPEETYQQPQQRYQGFSKISASRRY